MKKSFSLILCAFFFSFGCANENPSKKAQHSLADPQTAAQDSLRNVLMEIHDAVMPRMSEVNRLQRQLRTWMEAHPDASEEQKQEILKTLDWLRKADDGMMEWMAGFKQPDNLRDSLSHDAIMNYLLAEQQKVQIVSDDINGSIEAATTLLNKLNAE